MGVAEGSADQAGGQQIRVGMQEEEGEEKKDGLWVKSEVEGKIVASRCRPAFPPAVHTAEPRHLLCIWGQPGYRD